MSQDIKDFLNNGYYFKEEEKKEIAVLMIHGFAASPIELQPLAEYLKSDYDIYAPVLPGHKTNIVDFSEKKYTDWLLFSENIYKHLQKEYKKIVLLGFSMGGSICLYLATKKAPYKIVTLSSPINFLDSDFAKILLLNWKKTNFSLSMVLSELKEISKTNSSIKSSKIKIVINNIYKKIIKEFSIENKDMKKYIDTYDQISYPAIQEIFKLVKYVNTQLSKVDSELLIIHSRNDYLIPFTNAKEILNKVSSNNIELYLLENSGHQIMIDKEYLFVFKKVKEFITREQLLSE